MDHHYGSLGLQRNPEGFNRQPNSECPHNVIILISLVMKGQYVKHIIYTIQAQDGETISNPPTTLQSRPTMTMRPHRLSVTVRAYPAAKPFSGFVVATKLTALFQIVQPSPGLYAHGIDKRGVSAVICQQQINPLTCLTNLS